MDEPESCGCRRVFAALVVASALFAASLAEARSVTVRWRHPAPARVAGFRIHLGGAPGDYTRVVDVGRLTADAQGIYHFELEVADDGPTYLVVTAYGAKGEESVPSNEALRSPTPTGDDAAGLRLGTPGRPHVVGP